MKNCNSRFLVILLGAVRRNVGLDICRSTRSGQEYAGITCSGNPACCRENVGNVGRLLFIKTNSNREKKTGLHKRQYVQGIQKKVLRTHAMEYGKKETRIINISNQVNGEDVQEVHVITGFKIIISKIQISQINVLMNITNTIINYKY